LLVYCSEGHFRLETLYCNDVLDISQIIKSQTELQIFGLYEPRGTRHIPKILEKLHNAQLFLPIVVTLERKRSTLDPDHITIFPAFYSVDRWATIHQVLTQSFCNDRGKYMTTNPDNILDLSIYVIDSSDMPSISELAKNMAVSFPQLEIGNLHLCFKRRSHIVSFLFTDRSKYNVYYFSHHKRLKKSSLFFPVCVG
jgi:hypothetical protein